MSSKAMIAELREDLRVLAKAVSDLMAVVLAMREELDEANDDAPEADGGDDVSRPCE